MKQFWQNLLARQQENLREEFKLNKRIVINMISSADMVAGQGVGSAYEEQVQLVKEGASDIFDVRVNEHCKSDINHFHVSHLSVSI